MRTVVSVASVLACVLSLDAQITATLNRLPDGLPEIRIRNNSAAGLAAFVLRLNPVVQSDAHLAPLMVYVDTAVDATAMPLAPNQERRVPVTVRFRPGRHVEDLFEPPIVSAGILADGTTVGDAALLTRLVLRRSNMLQAVEMALETLSDAGRHNVPRGELIAQFRKMADSVILPGIRKAAILLVALGDQAGAEFIRHLSEDEVQLVSREVARIPSITSEQAEAVIEEFYQTSMARDFAVKGGLDYARNMLVNAFGQETAKKLVDRLVKALGAEAVSLDALQKADPQQLAKFVHSEHPQTIALVLSHLDPTQAAALLVSLPPNLRGDVAMRMANLDQISPGIIHKIAGVIGQKLKALGEFSRESYGGVRAVAELFNRLDSMTSKEILESVEQQDGSLADTIRHLMFVFEDILMIDSNGMKELLGKIDRKLLTVALKGTSEQLRDHFLQAMSQRGAEMLKEDMDALGPTKIKDVEAAQQQIITVIRQMDAEGALSLKGAGSEQYVV